MRATAVGSGMDFLIFVAVITAIYFLPTIVAWGKPQAGTVFLLNLFLGWSLIGWVVALLWALWRDDGRPRLEQGPRWRVPPGSDRPAPRDVRSWR
jgi:hypothetical protein